MADDIRRVRFNPPVYKNKTTNPGVLVSDGDVITVVLKGVSINDTDPENIIETHPTQTLTVLKANDAGTVIDYEFDAGNQFVLPNRIIGVIPLHTWECAAPDNYGKTDTSLTTVTSFAVNGVVHTETYPITAVGAADLQKDLNAALGGNGAASVSWVDAATDYFKVYVMNTTAIVKINNVALPVLP
jgi:hypothetical protein